MAPCPPPCPFLVPHYHPVTLAPSRHRDIHTQAWPMIQPELAGNSVPELTIFPLAQWVYRLLAKGWGARPLFLVYGALGVRVWKKNRGRSVET